jgi:hypothetical protein
MTQGVEQYLTAASGPAKVTNVTNSSASQSVSFQKCLIAQNLAITRLRGTLTGHNNVGALSHPSHNQVDKRAARQRGASTPITAVRTAKGLLCKKIVRREACR